jgi:hypothetical protein
MNCIVCNSNTEYFFTKDFNKSSEFDKKFDLGEVEYWKCSNCGLVNSKTHSEMNFDKWTSINNQFHYFIENETYLDSNQPPYLEMAMLIKILFENEIVFDDILDYGAGYGTLSNILNDYFNFELKIFDQYIMKSDKRYTKLDSSSVFGNVITSAVFEHLTERSHFDNIKNLINSKGAMFIHTLICENVPKNPNWFYLLPVHTTFFTNKSMDILMRQWDFSYSLYCPKAKTWVLLHEEPKKSKIEAINQSIQSEFLILKEGFVDYWKTF